MNSKRLIALGSSLLLGIAGVVTADTTTSTDLRTEVTALKARIAELEGRQNSNWLNERRAEEVKALVREVLSDADTRASLLENGMAAGHNGKNFFLASEDGSFLMTISGQIQVRYIANWGERGDDVDAFSDDYEGGFEIPRTKLNFEGHVADPRLQYQVRLALDRLDNDVFADTILIRYEWMDGVQIWGGETKAPFLREELVESYHQLAVERSLLNEIFTAGYVQGVGITWDADATNDWPLKVAVTINDGARSGEAFEVNDGGAFIKPFDQDNTDFAVTGRADVKLAGDWDQWQDFQAWSGQELGVFLGAAIHYEEGETGDDVTARDNIVMWTVDGSVEVAGLGVYGAFVGQHYNGEGAVENGSNYGALIQASYMVIPDKLEPFVRYEWIDVDSDFGADDDIHVLTFGANYFLRQHNAKLTVDLVWALEPVTAANTFGTGGPGLLGLVTDDAGQEDQVALRAQFQLLF